MNEHGTNGDMHKNDYSLMGAHLYWWVALLVIALIVLVALRQYRKRK